MFIDKLALILEAGSGGNGIVSWRREKYIPKGGPAGGNGGKGGSIIIEADRHLLSLEDLRNYRILKAKNGKQGGSSNKHGKNAEDLIIKVPLGTLIKDKNTQAILCDLTEDKEQFMICKGGKGGKGNSCFKSATNRAPNICTLGKQGEKKEIELELKLIADIGLVGMPNAGKSTLLKKLTKVEVKIAAYPFTTLRPNLGIMEFSDYSRLLMADIPGLIKNASQNKGLGISFLKHLERTSVLVFVIDLAQTDGRDCFEDFLILQKEIKKYNSDILKKPFLIALNKIDLPKAKKNLKTFQEKYQKLADFPKNMLFPISAQASGPDKYSKLNLLATELKKLGQKEKVKF